MDPDDIDMIEGVDGQWYVFGPEGAMLTPDAADQFALALVRMAADVRLRNT